MINLQVYDMVLSLDHRSVRLKNRSSSKNIFSPIYSTGEAFTKAYAISQIDGPLPIADVIGLTYAVFEMGSSWNAYFN